MDKDRVLIDTTVFCAAIISKGINYKLLEFANNPQFFDAVISDVVICEFIEHCRKGLKKVKYTENEIDLFFEGLYPLLDSANIKRIDIGKEMWVNLIKSKQPIEQYLHDLFYEKTGFIKQELLTSIEHEGKKLENIDHGDLHVMYGAIQYDCNIIVTRNTDDFPKLLGKIEIIKPGTYLNHLIGPSDW